MKRAKGFFQGRSKLYRTAKETVIRAMAFSTRDRKKNRRNFRSLWIVRLNAACRKYGMSYSKFIHALNKANIALDRKSLAELAVRDEAAFGRLAELVKQK